MYSNIEAGAVVYHKSNRHFAMLFVQRSSESEDKGDCKFWNEEKNDFDTASFYYYELVDTGKKSEHSYKPYKHGDEVEYIASPNFKMVVIQILGSNYRFACRYFNPLSKNFEIKEFNGYELNPVSQTEAMAPIFS